MGKKIEIDIKNAPVNLSDNPFYGLKLDEEQKEFRDAIWSKEKIIVFCDAKAGTGKTTIATMTAKLLYDYRRYDGIIYIAAPTQEQKMGYLPGTADEKASPYFEPFYQACRRTDINIYTDINQMSIMNQKNGGGYIDCLTHVYLRGVNFENKVVILDECQNYYLDELKKTLTRMHDSCKVVVIGHSGQIDIYKNPERSGFVRYLEHFRDDDRCAVCRLSNNYRGWISTHADSLTLNKE